MSTETGAADLSQSEKRESETAPDTCPCITPGGVYMLLDRLRMLVAAERLALQGICVKPWLYEMFNRDFWNSLSGNGFCAPVLMVLINAFLMLAARRHAISVRQANANSAADQSSGCGGIDVSAMVDLISEGVSGLDADLDLCNALLADTDFAFDEL